MWTRTTLQHWTVVLYWCIKHVTFDLFFLWFCFLMFCSQLFQNPDNRTTYTVQRREEVQGLDNTLRYPLVENMDYVVRVRNISCVCVHVVWGGYLNELSLFLFHDLFMRTLSPVVFPPLLSSPILPPPFTTLTLSLLLSSFFRYLLPTQLVMEHPQRTWHSTLPVSV